jgi:hypothetical protein
VILPAVFLLAGLHATMTCHGNRMDEEQIAATVIAVETLDPEVGASVAAVIEGLLSQVADLEDALEAAGGEMPAADVDDGGLA